MIVKANIVWLAHLLVKITAQLLGSEAMSVRELSHFK
jgi:hypothetical protein